MRLRQLFESRGVDAAFCFGRFNPAHQGHIEVWKAVQDAGDHWYVGTNPSTAGANDPLPYPIKKEWMEAIYPELAGHIIAEQSVVTLASKIFELLGKNPNATIAYVTDSQDWAWAGKLLMDYNGKEGPHGMYKFANIIHVESPRVSSATALRTAARAGDEQAFYSASGTDPKLTVNGKSYFETVVEYCAANPEKIKKPKKEKAVAEGEGDPEGLPHITKELISHIIQQVGTEGAHAIVKSLQYGDGAAKELLQLIVKDLKQDISMAESVKQRLDPKCWKGKHKEGTKIKGGVRVNNCVPNESKGN